MHFEFCSFVRGLSLVLTCLGCWVNGAVAQSAPSGAEIALYSGLLAAAQAGEVDAVRREIAGGAKLDVRDPHGRTPLMLAAYRKDHATARVLIAAGADLDALDRDRYDVLTISGVADDPEMVRIVLEAGANPGQTTSPYDGTALIASAHLGRVEVVRALIKAGAPFDHINNLAWTALIEAIVLGDGGMRHQTIVRDLLAAGADPNIRDGNGLSPLTLAKRRGYKEMVEAIAAAGGRE